MKKTSVILAAVITVCLLLQTFSLAWISDNGLSSLVNITGNVHKNYFEGGDGSAEDPYIIARPVQLYYFAWLQYLGFFNPDENGDKKIDTTYYFKLSENLDMKENGVQYVLPPIGTTDNPFVGNFDGDGYTISNLVVRNNYNSLSAPPNNTDNFGGAEIIGFFGVIGSPPNYAYTYDSEANQISNFVLENITVETQTDKALIGMIAGYVNGLVDKVGVVGSTVSISKGTPLTNITDNMSDYALIGFCTDTYKNDILTVNLDLFDPKSERYEVVPPSTSGGGGQGWGGSVAMNTMFTMLKTIRDTNGYYTNTNAYIYERVDAIINGNTVTLDKKTDDKRVYYDANFGAIVYSPRSGTSYSDSNTQDFNYLSGSTRVTLIECKASGTDDGYYIYNGTNYLTVTGNIPNVSLGNTTSQGNASIWRFSNGANGGTAYTEVDGHMYYLCLSDNTLTLYSAGIENGTSWSVSNNGIYSGGSYIDYKNNAWTISTAGKKIHSGNNYMTVTSNGNLGNETNSSSAVTWIFENINGSGRVYAEVGNQKYYLRYNNGLTVTTTESNATNWTYNSNNGRLYYNNRYIRYSNGWTTTTNQNNATSLTLTDSSVTTNTKLSKSNDKVDSYTYTSTFMLDNNGSNRYFDAQGDPVITTNLANKGITYYPLTFEYNSNNKPEVSTGNTGYVISSSYDTTTSGTYPDRTGDIRVSQYPTSSNNTANMSNRTNPYCMNYTTSSFTQVNSLNGKGLNKYSDCYDTYYSSTQSSYYGIHFMDAQISKYSIITVDNVTILGKTYDNYEMPTSCIDFNLKEAGFINFFAGTYFSNNNAFFSLHKIERGKDEKDPETYNKILSIKEIQYIYGVVRDGKIDFSVPYYYTYKDGTSDQIDSKYASETYQIIFNTDWITNPTAYGTWRNNSSYYFEIPVYAGEYALGSVEGKTGAYLVYLDLAANAQVIDRTRVDEMSITTEQAGSIPNGVSILESAAAGTGNINPENSVFVSIGTGNAGGTLTLNNSTVTDSGTGHTATHIGSGLQLVDGKGNPMTVPITRTITVEQSTYYDVNMITSYETVTVIRKYTIVEGDTTTVYYTKSVVATDAEGNPAYDINGDPLSKPEEKTSSKPSLDVPDDKTATQSGSFKDVLITMQYVVSSSDDMTVNHSCNVTMDDNGNVTDSVYTLTLNNTAAAPLPVAFTLTEYGVSKNIQFIVVAGGEEKTLANNINKQSVTVPVQQIAP